MPEDRSQFHPGGKILGQVEHLVPGRSAGTLIEGRTGMPIPGKNLVEVKLSGTDAPIPCLWISGVMSGLLGINTSFTPGEGVRVLIYYTGREVSYILGAWPDTKIDQIDPRRSMTETEALQDLKVFRSIQSRANDLPTAADHKPPSDLLPGELCLDNLAGVGLQLLRHLASLEAGGLARVECHLLDDLVRIISRNFRQHHALGDYSITNDHGRLNAVFHGTSLEHESWGLTHAGATKMETEGEADFQKPLDSKPDEGRWRFSQFVGWLGDFVHIFVTDPVDSIGRLAEDAVRPGRFRAHVNSDGSLLVQSVADICFEKVVQIPVPIQLRREDDPEGDAEPPDTAAIPAPIDNDWKPSSQQSIFEMVFQLREYARWFNNQLAFARFRQLKKDWLVPTEQGVADAVNETGLERNSVVWIQSYACIRIYRDGSVQQLDAYGNAVTLSAMGVQISSTRDLLLCAAGSVNILAGRDVNLRAKRNATVSADEGKLTGKGAAIQLMASQENIVMETVVGKYTYLISTLRVGTDFEVARGGAVKCVGDVSVNTLQASGTIRAGDMMHATPRLAGLGPHSNHVAEGPAGPVVTLPALTGEFRFLDTNYGPARWYEPVSEGYLTRGEALHTGPTWNLTADPNLDRGKPWPGTLPYYFTPAGAALKTPSAASQFTNQPAAMQTKTAVLHVQT